MSRKDDMSKTVIAICGTALALFYATAKFGGILVKGKSCWFWSVVVTAALFVVAVILYCCNTSCYNTESDFCLKYSKLYKTADEWNLAYWIDSSNESKKVPNGKKYLYVKGDVDFSRIEFENAKEIVEIHFCASQLAISAGQAKKLKAAKIFLDCGKSCVEIK